MSRHNPVPVRARLRRLSLARALALVAAASATTLSGVALAADTGTSSSGGEARASQSGTTLRIGSRGVLVEQLQVKLGVAPTGYYGTLTVRAVKRFQRRRGLTADGVAGPATLRALGIRVREASRSTGGVGANEGATRPRLPAVLRRIAQCESGGNPRAVSADGRYRGKYQFDRATWRAWGGTGDPAKAPEAQQDRVALRLYRARGTAPWPNCA